MLGEWEDGLLEDFRKRLLDLAPPDIYYAHDDLSRRTQNIGDWEEPINGHSHIAHMIMGGSSHTIPVGAGRPLLGRWQRLLLVELDGARQRDLVFHCFGE